MPKKSTSKTPKVPKTPKAPKAVKKPAPASSIPPEAEAPAETKPEGKAIKFRKGHVIDFDKLRLEVDRLCELHSNRRKFSTDEQRLEFVESFDK